MKEVAVSRAELLRLLEASGAKASENEDILSGQCWLSFGGKSYILEGSAEAVSAGLGRAITKAAPTTPSRTPRATDAPHRGSGAQDLIREAKSLPSNSHGRPGSGASLIDEAKGVTPADPSPKSLIEEAKSDDFPGAA